MIFSKKDPQYTILVDPTDIVKLLKGHIHDEAPLVLYKQLEKGFAEFIFWGLKKCYMSGKWNQYSFFLNLHLFFFFFSS